jgi:carbonic anhydrase/acetyltransferase-like protein (isoleucine patch superfamily)
MPAYPFEDRRPQIDPTAFVAPGARLVGDVTLGPQASVWFNAVLRGDSDAVSVGARTNIQDGAVLHTDGGVPCIVAEDCTIGHLAIVHGCRVDRGSLIGMGAVVLSGAVIGEESLVAAGAVVPGGRRIPARSLVAGSPVRLVRKLSDEDVGRLIKPAVANYLRFAASHRDAGLVLGDPPGT